ncbi:MAG: hypothetical protein WA705_16805 [Candidatus Ozemobacteraceae bacterium]
MKARPILSAALILAVLCSNGYANAWERGGGGGGGNAAAKREEIKARIEAKRDEIKKKIQGKLEAGKNGGSAIRGNNSSDSDGQSLGEKIRERLAGQKGENTGNGEGLAGLPEKIQAAKVQGAGGTTDNRIGSGHERWATFLAKNPQFTGFFEKTKALRGTDGIKDPAIWKQRLEALRTQWQALLPQDRSNAAQKFPCLADRIEKGDDPKIWGFGGKHTGPRGNTQTFQGATQVSGKNVTTQETWTGQKGGTGTYKGSTVREGNTLTHDASITGSDGTTSSGHTVASKDANGVHVEGDYTGPNGKTWESTATHVEVGDTVQTTETVTDPNGEAHTFTGKTTFESDGRDTTWTSDTGKTRSHDIDRTHDGNTISRKDSWTGPNGETGTVTGSTTGTAK